MDCTVTYRRASIAALGVVLAGLVAACSAGRAGAPEPTPQAAVMAAAATHASVAPADSAAPVHEVRPAPTGPCARNTARRFVRVSLRAQHLWMCAGHTPVYSTPITSGMAGEYTGTPTGHFRIEGLQRHQVLTLNTGRQYTVQYWIPFQAPLFGFHDAPWQTIPFGSPRYRTDGSHGCVHMPLKAIAFLYRWADVGTSVLIA